MGKISKNELNTSLATKIEEIDLKANISDLETTNSQLAQNTSDLNTHTGDTSAHGVNTKVSKSGDTMSGTLNIAIDEGSGMVRFERKISDTGINYIGTRNGKIIMYSGDLSKTAIIDMSAKQIDFDSNKLSFGTGNPEGTLVGNVGDIRMRTDGGASTTFYVKQSGTGNTGWVAK